MAVSTVRIKEFPFDGIQNGQNSQIETKLDNRSTMTNAICPEGVQLPRKKFTQVFTTYYDENTTDNQDKSDRPFTMLSKLLSEFVGVMIFVYIGSSQAFAKGNVINAALAHGLTIFVLVASMGHISGGHFNPAVTLAVTLCGKMKPFASVAYVAVQLLGGFIGSLLVRATTTQNLFNSIDGGCLTLNNAYQWYQGLIIEIFLTFILTHVVMLCAVDTNDNILAPLAIGTAVCVDILANGVITGASMNPARSFGPALAASFFSTGKSMETIWRNHFIYWVGPFIGALITAILYKSFFGRGLNRRFC